MPLRFTHSQTHADLGEDSEQQALTLIEIARIRCQRLCSIERDETALATVYRDIGLAYYFCCDEMAPEARRRCLELAAERCRRVDEHRDGAETGSVLQEMFDTVVVASEALVDALVEHPSDHLHIAHLHALAACDALDDFLTLLCC